MSYYGEERIDEPSEDDFKRQRKGAAINKAKELLSHYLKMGLEAKGYQWNSDNDIEAGEIVDAIIKAAALNEKP